MPAASSPAGPRRAAPALAVLLFSFLLFAGPALAQTIFVGPYNYPYRSIDDVPPVFYLGGAATAVETFEDCSLDHDITITAATVGVPWKHSLTVTPPGCQSVSGTSPIDSVDADDGLVDDLGGGGVSYQNSGIMRFELPPGTTAAGLVYTDGPGSVYFAAFGPGNVPLGEIGPFTLDNGSIFSNVSDDYFLGVKNLSGIESIQIRIPSGSGLEVDHVQYGQAATLGATWDDGQAIQGSGGGLDPSLWVGLELTGASPTVTTPDAETVVLTYGGLDPNPTLQIGIASYGLPFYPPDPIRVVGDQIQVVFMQGGTMATLTIDITSSSGGLLDPLSVVGFNPQPEPPSPDLFAFSPPPAGDSEALGIQASLIGGSGPPSATQITLTLRLLDNASAPLPTAPIASVTPVPALTPPALGVLGAALAVSTLIALRRRSRAAFVASMED